MEIILYYNKEGKKQWIIAEKGNTVVESYVTMGYKREEFLVIDVTERIDRSVMETFGY